MSRFTFAKGRHYLLLAGSTLALGTLLLSGALLTPPSHPAATGDVPEIYAGIGACVELPTRDGKTAPISACFAPGTPDEVVQAVEDAMWDAYFANPENEGLRYQLTSRWTGSQGDPYTVTWSFVPDGLSIPSGVGEGTANSTLFATLDAQFASQGGRAGWIARFDQIFARWSQLSGLTYTRITVGGNDWDDGASWSTSSGSATRGEVRIAAKPIDGSSGILAYNFFPGTGNGGNMVIDSGDNWGSSSNQNRFLRNTLGHEHGHGMGLLHVCPANGTKLMEPFLNTSWDGPRHDDMRAAQRHYGDSFEPDNSAGTANPLGALTFNSSVTIGTAPAPLTGTNDAAASTLSIDANSEQDWFSFSVSAPALLDVTVNSVGRNYASYAQDSSCSTTTNNVDSRILADLAVDIRASDGTTILATGNTPISGTTNTESLVDVSLPSAGTYYMRVYETNAPGESQLYQATLLATAAPQDTCPEDLDGNNTVDSQDLALLLAAFQNGPGGDVDGDNATDSQDLALLLALFGQACP